MLPFTAEELFRGLAQATGDEQKAREVSQWFAEMLAGGADEGAGWSLPDVVFAAMALVSDDLRKRVDAYKRADWECRRWSLVYDALRREGLPGGSDPTPSALRAADEQIAAYAQIGSGVVLRLRSGCGGGRQASRWGMNRRRGQGSARNEE